jgi:uncharacterized protein YciI
MQFLVTACDGKDEKALERRLAAREEHLKLTEEMFKSGKTLYAAAILDDNDKMTGSVLIVDFPAREDLDKWLEIEPYVKGQVWEEIDIKPCKVGPMFHGLHS